jgi:hypothetical protein
MFPDFFVSTWFLLIAGASAQQQAEMVPILFPPTTDNDLRVLAYIGDRTHAIDVATGLQTSDDQRLQVYLRASAQAAWLRAFFPACVPPNHENGTPPSDHTVSTYFEYFYVTQPRLRQVYLLSFFANLTA